MKLTATDKAMNVSKSTHDSDSVAAQCSVQVRFGKYNAAWRRTWNRNELTRQIRTRLAGLEAAGIEWLPRMDAPIAAVEMASTKLSETPSVAIADHGNSLDR